MLVSLTYVLKKDKSLGGNANVNLTYSTGEVPRYNASVSGNYRNKAFNVFGSGGYYHGENVSFNNFKRQQSGFTLLQQNNSRNEWDGFNYRLGMDLFLNKKSTIGFLVNGNIHEGMDDDRNHSDIGRLGVVGIDSTLLGTTDRTNERTNYNFNLNYRFEGENGNVLNIDADYGRFDNEGAEFQVNTYMDPTESIVLQERINRTASPSIIDIYTFKVDHERPFLEGKLGIGGKVSLVTTDNTFDFFNRINGEDIIDIDRSNQFVYDEMSMLPMSLITDNLMKMSIGKLVSAPNIPTLLVI